MSMTGEVAAVGAPDGALIPELINLIDCSTVAGIPYSHIGFVIGGASAPEFLSMTHDRGLVLEPLTPVVAARGALVYPPPHGPQAATVARACLRRPVPYDMDQLMLAALASLLRGRGPGSHERERVWELIHWWSRRIVGVRWSACGPRHPIPGAQLAEWYCASFVDHAFRASGHCLCVEEPGSPSDRPASNAVVGFVRLITYLKHRLLGLARGPEAMYVIEFEGDAGSDLAPDDDGIAMDDPVGFGDIDAAALARALLRGDDGRLGSAHERELLTMTDILATDLEWTFHRLDSRLAARSEYTQLGAIFRDPFSAPRPGEPMWPPFMSLRLLMERLGSFSGPLRIPPSI